MNTTEERNLELERNLLMEEERLYSGKSQCTALICQDGNWKMFIHGTEIHPINTGFTILAEGELLDSESDDDLDKIKNMTLLFGDKEDSVGFLYQDSDPIYINKSAGYEDKTFACIVYIQLKQYSCLFGFDSRNSDGIYKNIISLSDDFVRSGKERCCNLRMFNYLRTNIFNKTEA